MVADYKGGAGFRAAGDIEDGGEGRGVHEGAVEEVVFLVIVGSGDGVWRVLGVWFLDLGLFCMVFDTGWRRRSGGVVLALGREFRNGSTNAKINHGRLFYKYD